MSLSHAFREHQYGSRPHTEHLKQEAKTALTNSIDLLSDSLNIEISKAFLLQKDLEAESKRLELGASQFAKQTRAWLNLVNNVNDALKELGDVENWAKAIEKDVRIVVGTLERASGVAEEDALGSSSVELVEAGASAASTSTARTPRNLFGRRSMSRERPPSVVTKPEPKK